MLIQKGYAKNILALFIEIVQFFSITILNKIKTNVKGNKNGNGFADFA